MRNDSSYDVRRIARSVTTEISRLGAQVDLFAAAEMGVYRRFGLRAGMAVADLGCGPGFLLRALRAAEPDLALTGVDIEPLLLERARDLLDDGGPAVTLLEGSIEKTGLADESVDFVVSRLVLEHLADPAAALGEVLRILRPDGVAVIVDNDFAMHVMTHPHIPELDDLYRAYCRSRSDEGGNPTIGRELPALLRAAGFADIRFDVISAHSQVAGTDAFLRSEGSGIPVQLVRDGYLDSRTLARLTVGWRAMLRRDDHAIIRQLYAAAGRKVRPADLRR
ncbi:methyltransferase domain-containing protein [Micromonospora tarensis]|uniref:Methyltransferase domain-containing protein n=1 Tax=Micromonospora tarensis TaxID=2806100 RepID=A0ABS1YFM2_9ACTN|nr:methyltransferase domain-containing protein [Micromonospora tarensis]MBM0276214.1 methyltransferase domain-containing protein [Micromonospora tarensis]